MIARAPGKLVLSGAYVVLEGAPALVAAVSRYAIADASREPDFIADEVREAIAMGAIERAPWIDASELRATLSDGSSRKLGLGSSAAILVASLGACLARANRAESDDLRAAVFPAALSAHRAAQGGGSGIDVAAATYGGILRCRSNEGGALEAAPHALPEGTVIEVFASGNAASTRELLALVRAYAARDAAGYRDLVARASEGALDAVMAPDSRAFARALAAQRDALSALGERAGAAIVPVEHAPLAEAALAEGAVLTPSGAGGGDVALYAGSQPSSPAFRAAAARAGLTRIPTDIGARGLHIVAEPASR